jgi:hypothetical protein
MNDRTAKFARRIILGVLCLVVLSATASVASACPSCQAALNSDANPGDLPRGIYYSILFMMSMPFAIVGTFSYLAYRAVKREQRRVAESKQASKSDRV